MADRENDATLSDEDQVEEEEEEPDTEFGENALLRYVWRSMALRHSLSNSNHQSLIHGLRRSGTLKTQRIIDTFLKTPRAEFILENMQDEAYGDHPLRFSTMGFNTSAPHMYAMCLEALQIEEGHSFLDIGSGCGLLTLLGAMLAGPTGCAVGLEIRQDIIDLSVNNVAKWKEKHPEEEYNLKFELRNCFLVDPEERKWDRIHVGACCPEYRLQHLIDALKPNGKLVTPYGDQLLLATKSSDGSKITRKTLADVRYGDLIVPSEAEVREAILIAESRKRQHIDVPETNGFDEKASNLFNKEKYSDFSIIVEGKKIPAHKLILRSRCEHFELMFESGMRESSSEQLIIDDFSYDQIFAALQVIYTGSCPIGPENAIELLEVANFYKLEWMKCQCELVLHENIEIETAPQIFAIADRFDAKQLRAASLEFLLKHHSEIIEAGGFLDLDRALLVVIIKEACSRATLDSN